MDRIIDAKQIKVMKRVLCTCHVCGETVERTQVRKLSICSRCRREYNNAKNLKNYRLKHK